MSDHRGETKEFFGFSREEVLASACAYFGKDAAHLQIVDLYEIDIAGLAGRKGMLVREIRGEGEKPSEARERRDTNERRPESRERRDAGGRRTESREAREEDRNRQEKKRHRDRDRREDRRDRGGEGSSACEETNGAKEAKVEESGRDHKAAEEPNQQPKPVFSAKKSSTKSDSGEEALSDPGEFIAGLIEHMKLGTFDINEKEDGKLLIVQLSGSAIEKLIANGGGRVLDSIQFLANQAELRREGEGRKVVIEAEGNEDKQREYLEKLALRAAKKAEETGKSIALDSMNSHDRRMVHMALKDAKDIATMSVGEGNYRRVVVVPKGAPEYEEALKSD